MAPCLAGSMRTIFEPWITIDTFERVPPLPSSTVVALMTIGAGCAESVDAEMTTVAIASVSALITLPLPVALSSSFRRSTPA